MFTTKTFQTIDFAPKYQNIEIGSQNFGIKSTAFLGVVSQQKGIFLFRTYHRSVNQDKFAKFLQELK